MKINRILKKINIAEKAIGIADSKLDNVLKEILPYLNFEAPETYFFHVENSTDGIILADSFAKIYAMNSILNHIETKGKINSYFELENYSI